MSTGNKTLQPFFDSPGKAWYFITGYLLLSAITRVLIMPGTLSNDEIEQVYLSQWFDAESFESQPPLYAWIHHAAFKLSGTNIYVLEFIKIAIIIITYFGILKIFTLASQNHAPTIVSGFLSLVFIFNLWDETLSMTNTILVTFASVLAVYMVLKITTHAKWGYYLLLGILFGIGFLSKYNIMLAIATLLLVCMSEQKTRKVLFSPYLLLTIAGFLVTIAPHAVWLIKNIGHAKSDLQTEIGGLEHETFTAAIFKAFVSFISNLFAFIGIWLLIILLFYRKEITSRIKPVTGNWVNFFRKYLIVITVLLIAVSLFIFKIGKFYERYFQPFYIFAPVYVFLKIGNQLSLTGSKQVWLQRLAVIVLLVTYLLNSFPAYINPLIGKRKPAIIPYHEVADLVNKESGGADLIIVSEIWFAGNLKFAMNNQKKVVVWNDPLHYKAETENHASRPVVYVWPADGNDIPEMITAQKNNGLAADSSGIRYSYFNYRVPQGKIYKIGMLKMRKKE